MQTFVPVDLQSTGELTAGLRPARIGYPQLVPRGLQIPEDNVFCFSYFVPVDLQSTGELTAGLRPARIEYPQISDSGIANPRGQCFLFFIP